MSKVEKKTTVKKATGKQIPARIGSPFTLSFTKENYILLGLGVFVLVLGFFFLSVGPWDSTTSLVIAPLVLMFAYAVIFPLSILWKKKQEVKANNEPINQ